MNTSGLYGVLRILERVTTLLRAADVGNALSELAAAREQLCARELDPGDRVILRPPLMRMQSALAGVSAPPSLLDAVRQLASMSGRPCA